MSNKFTAFHIHGLPPRGKTLGSPVSVGEQVGVLRFGPNPFTSFTDFPPGGRRLAVALAVTV